jgi:hypothetical protein
MQLHSHLIIFISSFGQYKSAISTGFFLGIIFVMCHQMLIVFAIFAERSEEPEETKTVKASQQAMAAFSFFLFLNYAIFGGLLSIFRDDIVQEGSLLLYFVILQQI